MSHEATNWAIKRRGLRPMAKLVLWHLADCHNPTMGCFPTQEYLAQAVEVSRASVNRVLDELEAAGMVRREQQIDPETKRQRPTRYRLAFEDGFEPLPVEPRVSEIDTGSEQAPCLSGVETRVSNAGGAVSQSYETLTSNVTGNVTSKDAPQPPASGGQRFAEMWEAWPRDHRGRRENAEGAFARMELQDQCDALRLAPEVIAALAKRKARVPALVAYLRRRVFADFDGAPEIDPDGYFIIKPGMPEWGEWLGWARRNHGDRGVQQIVMAGRFLTKTRLPEREAA